MLIDKSDLARSMGLKVFDCALPQAWVDLQDERGFDVRPHFVWCYDFKTIFGEPFPVTEEGKEMNVEILKREIEELNHELAESHNV